MNADYVSEHWQAWDHLDKVTFIQCMTQTLTSLDPNTDWKETTLYQRWNDHRRSWRAQKPLEPPFTYGEAYRLACDLYDRTLTIHTIGIK